jgi:hypothetical protein
MSTDAFGCLPERTAGDAAITGAWLLGRTPTSRSGLDDLRQPVLPSTSTPFDSALQAIIDEAVATKAPLVEIVPGKGSGQLKKPVELAVLIDVEPYTCDLLDTGKRGNVRPPVDH